MKTAIQDLTESTVSSVIKSKNDVQMDTIFNSLKEVIDDVNEDTLLQKQEIEDLVIGMEGINIIKELLIDFKKITIATIQKELMEYIKSLFSFKNNLIEKLKALELKKKEEIVANLLEEEFNIYSEKITKEFTTTFFSIVEENFKSTKNAIEKAINTMFQYRNEFKMLLLGMISNFEEKMNIIFELVKDKRGDLDKSLSNLMQNVNKKVNAIIQKLISQVSEIHNPIVNVLNQYLEQTINQKRFLISDVWPINNKTKLKEEITHLINRSTETLTLVIPKIEDFLTIEEIQNLDKQLKINIASSDPSTNSRVKNILENKNLQFRQLHNKNIVIGKGDDDYFIVGLILEGSNDKLKDFMGIGCNNPPLINILKKIIEKILSNGQIDSFKPIKKIINSPNLSIKDNTPKFSKVIQSPPPINSFSSDLKNKLSADAQQTNQISSPNLQTQYSVQDDQELIKMTPIENQPVINTETGKIINEAFNNLISKLDGLKGDEFSRELDIVAQLILEKKGFSVTLHNLRSCINNYKDHVIILNQIEKQQIIDAIESWRQHLLK